MSTDLSGEDRSCFGWIIVDGYPPARIWPKSWLASSECLEGSIFALFGYGKSSPVCGSFATNCSCPAGALFTVAALSPAGGLLPADDPIPTDGSNAAGGPIPCGVLSPGSRIFGASGWFAADRLYSAGGLLPPAASFSAGR